MNVYCVMDDDWDAVNKYCQKCGIPMPKNPKVMKAGVYKAVAEWLSRRKLMEGRSDQV